MSNKGLLVVLSGPSGSGKDTILERLVNLDKNIVKSISATTRPCRIGEVDGKDYFFISEQDFCNAISDEKLLEYKIDKKRGHLFLKDGKFIQAFSSIAEASRAMGVTDMAIGRAIKRNGTSCGFIWKKLN